VRVCCGVDIVDVKRIEDTLTANAKFAAKVFTEAEVVYCESKKLGKYESYAARFAAKEAFLKALGIGMYAGAALTEIEVVKDRATGRPDLRLSGGAADIYGKKDGFSISVSLSHTEDTAIAIVVMMCGG
jgi:holo-[acyl-carrier protein] synthase